MEAEENDLDRIEQDIGTALAAFIGNTHESFIGDSITMTKDGFIGGIIRLQRLRNHVKGLAESHRKTQSNGGKDGPD
ncbi:hypothetical protein LCGC14_1439840 [marine sediment metagenome]|uniref:Uncharacterized protein n=1 Tax=marine sediment metagenome TaxID=412755 RepID=A0A0F9JLJ8_9ZZZZ